MCYNHVLQVRAAAVFALGTFISNVKSDHANSINLSVGMKLVHVANDGSPLVRKVRLLWLVFTYYLHLLIVSFFKYLFASIVTSGILMF